MALKAKTGSDSSIFDELANFGMKYHHALAELIDNSISSADANKISPIEIVVSLKEMKSGNLEASVKDNSWGVPKKILVNKLFEVAGKASGGTYLNEHGMGFLNVISMAEDHGCKWSIRTATEISKKKNISYSTKYPYNRKGPQIVDENLFTSYNRVGTTVRFEVPVSYAGTVAEGKSGGNPTHVDKIAALLREHFGVIYRPRFEKGDLNLTVKANSKFLVGAKSFSLVDQKKKLTKFKVAIPGVTGQHLTISGEIGLIPEKSDESAYYYAGTGSSRGVDVRFGDRILASRVISDIWKGQEGHSTLNRLAGEIYVKANKKATPYPKTRPDKSGIKAHDPLWLKICDEIVSQIPKSDLPKWKSKGGSGKTEEDLQDELQIYLQGPAGKFGNKKKFEVHTKQPVDATSHIESDLIVMPKTGSSSIPLVVECKRDESRPLDAYQLVMYWHAITNCIKASNPIKPNDFYDVDEGWVVALKHSAGIQNLVKRLNNTEYSINGKVKKFNIKLFKWSDFGISPK